MGQMARDLRHLGLVVFKNFARTTGELRLNSKDLGQHSIIFQRNKVLLHLWRRNVCVSLVYYRTEGLASLQSMKTQEPLWMRIGVSYDSFLFVVS